MRARKDRGNGVRMGSIRQACECAAIASRSLLLQEQEDIARMGRHLTRQFSSPRRISCRVTETLVLTRFQLRFSDRVSESTSTAGAPSPCARTKLSSRRRHIPRLRPRPGRTAALLSPPREVTQWLRSRQSSTHVGSGQFQHPRLYWARCYSLRVKTAQWRLRL